MLWLNVVKDNRCAVCLRCLIIIDRANRCDNSRHTVYKPAEAEAREFEDEFDGVPAVPHGSGKEPRASEMDGLEIHDMLPEPVRRDGEHAAEDGKHRRIASVSFACNGNDLSGRMLGDPYIRPLFFSRGIFLRLP